MTGKYTVHYTVYCTLYYILYTILYTVHYAILYYTILCYTILYYTILYYTILYYTILYYTILYYTNTNLISTKAQEMPVIEEFAITQPSPLQGNPTGDIPRLVVLIVAMDWFVEVRTSGHSYRSWKFRFFVETFVEMFRKVLLDGVIALAPRSLH